MSLDDFRCWHCKGRVAVDEGMFGQTVNCPHCNELITIPLARVFGLDEAPADAPASEPPEGDPQQGEPQQEEPQRDAGGVVEEREVKVTLKSGSRHVADAGGGPRPEMATGRQLSRLAGYGFVEADDLDTQHEAAEAEASIAWAVKHGAEFSRRAAASWLDAWLEHHDERRRKIRRLRAKLSSPAVREDKRERMEEELFDLEKEVKKSPTGGHVHDLDEQLHRWRDELHAAGAGHVSVKKIEAAVEYLDTHEYGWWERGEEAEVIATALEAGKAVVRKPRGEKKGRRGGGGLMRKIFGG